MLVPTVVIFSCVAVVMIRRRRTTHDRTSPDYANAGVPSGAPTRQLVMNGYKDYGDDPTLDAVRAATFSAIMAARHEELRAKGSSAADAIHNATLSALEAAERAEHDRRLEERRRARSVRREATLAEALPEPELQLRVTSSLTKTESAEGASKETSFDSSSSVSIESQTIQTIRLSAGGSTSRSTTLPPARGPSTTSLPPISALAPVNATAATRSEATDVATVRSSMPLPATPAPSPPPTPPPSPPSPPSPTDYPRRSAIAVAAEAASDRRALWVGRVLDRTNLRSVGAALPALRSALGDVCARSGAHDLPSVAFAGPRPRGCRPSAAEVGTSIAMSASAQSRYERKAVAGAASHGDVTGSGATGSGSNVLRPQAFGQSAPSGPNVDCEFRRATYGPTHQPMIGGSGSGGVGGRVASGGYEREVQRLVSQLQRTLWCLGAAIDACCRDDGIHASHLQDAAVAERTAVAQALSSLAQGAGHAGRAAQAGGCEPLVASGAAREILRALGSDRRCRASKGLYEALSEALVEVLIDEDEHDAVAGLAERLRRWKPSPLLGGYKMLPSSGGAI